MLEAYLQLFPTEASGLEELANQLLDSHQDPFDRRNLRGHVTTSALVLSPNLDHLLMIDHRALKRWLPPGEHFEGTGSLWQSAAREVAEETGVLRIRPFDKAGHPGVVPFNIDSHPIAANPDKGEGAHHHHDFWFLAIAEACEPLIVQEAEVHAARWVPLREFMGWPERDMRRLAAKLLAVLAPSALRTPFFTRRIGA